MPLEGENSRLKTRDSQNVHYMSIPIKRASVSSYSDDQMHAENTYRRHLLDQPIGSFKGVNSLGRFASSLRRANSFMNIEVGTEKERTYFKDGQDALFDPYTLAPSADGRRISVAVTSRGGVSVRPSMGDLYISPNSRADGSALYDDQESFSAVGSVASNEQGSLRRPTLCFQDLNNATDPDSHSIMLKQVEMKNGQVVTLLAGQSTAPQTIFNAVNVLIGIGLFALPLGLRFAGCVIGILLLALFAASTFCSAELLSRCQDVDPTMISYGDLAYATFGPKGRALISILFTLDLLGSGVALIIIFGDSLNALFPQYSVTFFKVIAFFAVTPQACMPLSIQSNFSLLGIMCTLGTVFSIAFCGLYKTTSPGSLLDPVFPPMWPESFKGLCLSIGLLSACWGGHAVFPNLKSDMRHPGKFKKCLVTTYSITTTADISTALFGVFMFGINVRDEVTKSIQLTEGYPQIVYVLISVLMTLIPIAKAPLSARPIASVMDSATGASPKEDDDAEGRSGSKRIIRTFNGIFVNMVMVIISILLPQFDKFIAFLGAGLCFAICLILPCIFYMSICAKTVKRWEKIACVVTIIVSTIFSILGVGAAVIS
ncbi:LANO_0E14730g1_1 [Lachancea nothofagi CBS 11611]|uniref:LANO_0E14730g1_1 n=1 Tax=Lachancea nothofagi CBS 11611 TaxID=1266666 RepID=A0A1G4K0C3_9SACH|nr:LANO_0E14730g1_1 [Lachancea nothofagi CBS 11611]